MPKVSDRVYSYGGGLDSSTNPANLREDELSAIRNYELTTTGALKSRNGQARIITAPANAHTVTSLFRHYKRDGSKYTIFSRNTSVLYQNGTDGTAIDATTFTADTTFSYATFNNILYYTNGVDTVSSQTMRKAATIGSNTATAPSASPATNCKYLLASTKMRRLIAAGSSTVGERLYGSALGNGEDWTTANDAFNIDIVTDDGEAITGIVEIAAGILVFKTSSIHLITGSDPQTIAVQPISTDVGCTAPHSIAANRTTAFFLWQNRVYQCDGARVFWVSQKITPTIDGMTSLTDAVGIVYKEQYRLHCTVSGSSAHNRVLVYYFQQPTSDGRRPWSQFDTIAGASACILSGENGELYTGDYAGYINQQDTTTLDFAAAITSYADTPWDHQKQPERVKKYKTLWVDVEPTGNYNLSVYVSYGYNQNTTVADTISLNPSGAIWGSFLWGGATWGGAATAQMSSITLVGTDTCILLRFQCANPNKIYGHSIIYRPKRLR